MQTATQAPQPMQAAASIARSATVFLGFALRQQVQVGDLGGNEEHGGGVLADRDAGAAADAGGGVHGAVRGRLGNREGVAVGRAAGVHRNEAAGLDDAIEGAAVGHQVLDDGEGLRPPRFDGNRIAVFEMPQVKLARGSAAMAAMGDAADDERAHAADAFPAVGVKGNRIFAARNDVFVHDVEHLQERHVRDDVPGLVGLELAGGIRVLLPPNFESQVHL